MYIGINLVVAGSLGEAIRQYKVVILVIALSLSGCSSFKLIYNFVDDFIKREAVFFLKLDEQGEAFLQDQVDKLMAWHNTVMLPRYATYLRRQADQLDKGVIDAVAIAKSKAEGRVLLEATVAGASGYAAGLLTRHTTSKNIDHIRRKMLVRRKVQQEKLLRPRENRTVERGESLINNFERFMGNLNDAQEDLIRRHAEATVDDTGKRLGNYSQRQSAFLTFLAGKPTEQEIASFIERILLRSHEIVDPNYQYFSKSRMDRFARLLVDILAASTPRQRKMTAAKLRGYAQDCTDLSRL